MKPALILFVGLVSLGCAPRDEEVRLRRLKVDQQTLLSQIERLEERMMASQARVRFWREMRERHQSATAVACANLEGHAESVALLAHEESGKLAALSRQRRVASRWAAAR